MNREVLRKEAMSIPENECAWANKATNTTMILIRRDMASKRFQL